MEGYEDARRDAGQQTSEAHRRIYAGPAGNQPSSDRAFCHPTGTVFADLSLRYQHVESGDDCFLKDEEKVRRRSAISVYTGTGKEPEGSEP